MPTEEIHHMKPLSEGGTHDRSNLIALCKSCHSSIHAHRGDYWGRTMSGGHRLCAGSTRPVDVCFEPTETE